MAAPMLTMARIGLLPSAYGEERRILIFSDTPYRRCKPRVDPAMRVR
jgi:hypothetical protein